VNRDTAAESVTVTRRLLSRNSFLTKVLTYPPAFPAPSTPNFAVTPAARASSRQCPARPD